MVLIRRLLVIAVFSAMLIAGWMFASANGEDVKIDLLAVRLPEVKLWLALAVAFAAGAVVAGTIGLLPLAKARMVTRRYRRTVAGLESEVHQLRNLPLASGDADAAESQGAIEEPTAKAGTGA